MNEILAVASIVIKELYRRKDFYVLFVLTVVICLLMGSVNIFNDDKIVRYLKEVCLLFIWISSLVIGVTTTARQIPAERENRTLFPLLAKPLARSRFIIGKFLGCWVACGLSLVCFYLFFGVLAASREHHFRLVNYVQAMGLHWCMLAVVVAFALLGSLVFAAPSSNATISFALIATILILGRHLHRFADGLPEPTRSVVAAIYFAMPHLELFDVRELIIHNWPPIAWKVWNLAAVYAFGYAALFVFAACLCFHRKAIN